MEGQKVERLEGQRVERSEGRMLGRLEGLRVERQEGQRVESLYLPQFLPYTFHTKILISDLHLSSTKYTALKSITLQKHTFTYTRDLQ